MLQSFVLLCWLLCWESGKFLHTLKHSKRQLPCVALPPEVCLFPLSVKEFLVSCTGGIWKVLKWAAVQEPLLAARL